MAENNDQLAEIRLTMTQMMETLKAMSEKLSKLEQASNPKNIERMVQRATDQLGYYETAEELGDTFSAIPEKFSAKDLPIFQPTDDPRFHLKGFRAIMSLKGIDHSLFPKVFPLSLDPVCQKWFYSLSDKETTTWEDVTHAFMTRYKCNTQNSTSRRELEILTQGKNESFTAFLTRWRQTAAQMVKPPPEVEMVSTFIENLQPRYKDHLCYLGLESFDKVYKIGIQIENDVLKEASENNMGGDEESDEDDTEDATFT